MIIAMITYHNLSLKFISWAQKLSRLLFEETKLNQPQSDQINCCLWGGGKTRVPREKQDNQQTQLTYDAESGNQTWVALVEGESSHHCANPAPCLFYPLI